MVCLGARSHYVTSPYSHGCLLGLSLHVLMQEVTYVVHRFSRRLKQFKVGGEDMHHSLPDVELGETANGLDAFCEAARVVEQDLVLTYMEKDGGGSAVKSP